MQHTLTDFQSYLFHEGNYLRSYESFGAHVVQKDGMIGTCFTVWAPHAKNVGVIGDFNEWNSKGYELKKLNEEGIWTGFFADVFKDALYKYEIITQKGEKKIKSDPYAFHSEVRPNTASIVYPLPQFNWTDQKWKQKKSKKLVYTQPLNIYEVHLGTWKTKEDGSLFTYQEYASMIIPHMIENGFTHIEILPLVEHPYDRSWGYQGTGYYSLTSRFGKPEDFMEFVNMFHESGLGVILDWVPGHFCKDEHGLYFFDGEPTYEYEYADTRENIVWGTANFDLTKPEVQTYLISCALFWLEVYHIDGFRIDAVRNILYWNSENEERRNEYGEMFLKKLNEAVFNHDENVLMIAEDSSVYPKVTTPTYLDGIGFNYKWNMGWMNDVLEYMKADPRDRHQLHSKITFSFLYTYTENFILPLSHDEVVHGKKSLLNKMPGNYEEKFAQLRLLMGYFYTHPGKKLLFMGTEIAQYDEWKDLEQLDWFLTSYPAHSKHTHYFKELSNFYLKNKSLYELDHDEKGFEWIDVNNWEQSVFSFIRRAEKEEDFIVVVCNFTGASYDKYKIGVPNYERYREVFNSDGLEYGGKGQENKKYIQSHVISYHGQSNYIEIELPSYGFVLLKPVKKREVNKKNEKKTSSSNVIGGGKRK